MLNLINFWENWAVKNSLQFEYEGSDAFGRLIIFDRTNEPWLAIPRHTVSKVNIEGYSSDLYLTDVDTIPTPVLTGIEEATNMYIAVPILNPEAGFDFNQDHIIFWASEKYFRPSLEMYYNSFTK